MSELNTNPVADRPDIVSVSSENFNAYVDSLLAPEGGVKVEKADTNADGHNKGSPVADKKGVDAGSSVDGDETTESVIESLDEKPKSKLQGRFSDLTEARKTAEAKAQTEREAREAAERTVAELKAKYEPPKPDVDVPEPVLAEFQSVEEWGAALKEWSKERTERGIRRQEVETKAKQTLEKTVTEFQKRQETAKADIPDYAEVIAASKVMVPNPAERAILESDFGPHILHYLASDESDGGKMTAWAQEYATALAAKDVEAMSSIVASANRLIGRLEARFEKAQDKVAAKDAVKPVAEISKAPAPISPLKGASSVPSLPMDSNGNWTGTADEYREARNAGKLKKYGL